MNDGEGAIRALIGSVLALSEATRATAAHGADDMERLQDLELRGQAVVGKIAALRAAVEAEIPFAALPATPEASGESVESLDELFDRIEMGDG